MSAADLAPIDEPGAGAAWRRVPWGLRAAIVVLAGILAVEFASGVAGGRTVPTAPTSPSAVGPQGTAALIRLLAARTHVAVANAPLDASAVPRGATLLVLDPTQWTDADRAVARGVAAAGGRVVFVGAAPRDPGPPLAPGVAVTATPVAVGAVVRTAPGIVTLGVRSLVTGRGALATAGAVHVDVAGQHGAFIASAGAVVWVGSSAPLRNANLAAADDAALAWNLALPWRRGIVVDAADMVEPATASGLRSLPTWWFTALGVAALAAAAWLASAARRFGPLEPRSRSLPPARAAHAEAMGSLLAGLPPTRVAEATEPVAAAARRSLLRRLRLGADAPDAAIREDAAAREVPDWVVRAAITAPASKDDAVATGRALAWLTEERGTR